MLSGTVGPDEGDPLTQINHQFRLAARPTGLPKPSDWEYTEEPVGEPGEGQVLASPLPLARPGDAQLDERGPLLHRAGRDRRGDARDRRRPRWSTRRHPGFAEGDTRRGLFGVQEYAVLRWRWSDQGRPRPGAPARLSSATLGIPGMTAYFGLLDVGRRRAGRHRGGLGRRRRGRRVTGQIAKLKGCRVIGIAGGAEKCRYLVEELGFDAAIDYKAEDRRARRCAEHCPDGIDVYFDNVGGEILDAVLPGSRAGRAW